MISAEAAGGNPLAYLAVQLLRKLVGQGEVGDDPGMTRSRSEAPARRRLRKDALGFVAGSGRGHARALGDFLLLGLLELKVGLLEL